MIRINKFIFNPFQENCYLLADGSGECAIIDPGCQSTEEVEALAGFVKAKELKPKMILLTHGHSDHVCGVRSLCEKYGIPAMMDPREQPTIEHANRMIASWGFPMPDEFEYTPLQDGESLKVGDTDIRVLFTPGHTLGGVCFWVEKENVIFTGDTLFAGSVGRTDNNWADYDALMKSLRDTLMQLDGQIDVFPGHGPTTSIGNERQNNPFLYEDYSLSELLKSDE